jgi:hypothetical protein
MDGERPGRAHWAQELESPVPKEGEQNENVKCVGLPPSSTRKPQKMPEKARWVGSAPRLTKIRGPTPYAPRPPRVSPNDPGRRLPV